MKTITTLCRLHRCIFLCSLFIFFIIQTGLAQQLPGHSQLKLTEGSTYPPGVINIKVKESIDPYSKQMGQVSFHNESLDRLVEEFEISGLAKRFAHKPIPRASGLPDISRIYKVEFPQDKNVWDVSSAFGDNPNIEYAEPVPIYRTAVIPDDFSGVDGDGNRFVGDVIGWDFREEYDLGDGSEPEPLWIVRGSSGVGILSTVTKSLHALEGIVHILFIKI